MIFRLAGGLMGMNADRAPDIAIALGDGAHGRNSSILVQMVTQRLHPCPLRARDDLGAVGLFGEIEMAMAIDEHQAGAAST